jgi:hypothetical protein
MTEPMIPLFVVDSKLKELLDNEWDEVMDYTIFAARNQSAIQALEAIKKEAIPNPYEQRIRDRISDLEKELNYQMDNGRYQTETTALLILKLDELRKLVEE